nr:PAC2 family protein [Candidatus Poseidoniales archaeon]
DAIAEGALVVSCFPGVSHVSSIVAHYLIERLELKFIGGVNAWAEQSSFTEPLGGAKSCR